MVGQESEVLFNVAADASRTNRCNHFSHLATTNDYYARCFDLAHPSTVWPVHEESRVLPTLVWYRPTSTSQLCSVSLLRESFTQFIQSSDTASFGYRLRFPKAYDPHANRCGR